MPSITSPAAPVGAIALPVSQSSISVVWSSKPGFASVSLYMLRITSLEEPTDWVTTEMPFYIYEGLDADTEYTFELQWCPLPGQCSEPVVITGYTV